MKLHELMQHKITVISGHFGSGKTNVAVNLALDAARAGGITDGEVAETLSLLMEGENFGESR